MKANRQSLLAKVHIAKKDLALDDDGYRTILNELFGVESSAKLKVTQLIQLVEHFEKLGFVVRPKNRPKKDHSPQVKRIWAQCYSLKRPVPFYADSLAKRMFKVEKLIWCDPEQLRAISAALAYQQNREGAETK